ncbi:MAG: hypothetical protein JWN46_2355 [Acidimicrobiales bacterium]|nr:hypothetical protein [Acidimicrobiales bacterium]
MNMRPHRAAWKATSAAIGLTLVGWCSACSVHFGYNSSDQRVEVAYRKAWLRDVSAINRASPAMAACQMDTGTPAACVKADDAMSSALQAMAADLARSSPPKRYLAGHNAMHQVLLELIDVLHLRDRSLQARDAAGLRLSVNRLSQIDFVKAVSAYPPDAGFSVDMSK